MANESLVIYSMNKVGRLAQSASSTKMILRDLARRAWSQRHGKR